MFQNFDKLFILKNGEQIFFDKANLLISYMENIGIEIDYTMNPSDFFML
jgi:ABC-type multidrug transport system ATPase subunit